MNTRSEQDFSKIGYRVARKQMTRDIQENIMGKNTFLRTLAIQSREGFREVYLKANSGETVDLIAIVSPPYTNNQEISGIEDYFTQKSSGLESRVAKKFMATVEAIQFLQKYFSFQVQIAIADTGLLLSEQYRQSADIQESLSFAEKLYQQRASELLGDDALVVTRMSRLIQAQTYTIVNMDLQPTLEDCQRIIRENAISPERLLRNLSILIKAFGITVAYYELQAYFQESRLIGENLGRSIIVNIEGTSVGNKLLTKGKDNLCIDRKNIEENRENRRGGNLLVGGTVTL